MTRRAEIHKGATLTPTKAELLGDWIPRQQWFTGEGDAVEQVAAFRFVDPAGAVGIETHLVRAGDLVFHVPLTYRDAPLEDADEALVGTMEHSALGTRYVYDAMSDPVYLAELERVIREGDSAVETVSLVDGTVFAPGLDVRGSGIAEGTPLTGELEVIGLVTDEPYADAAGRLVATLPTGGRDVVLAVLR